MQRVINLLPIGRENAVSMTALADMLNVSTTTVKKLVREARNEGYQIVSGIDGYWITDDPKEKRTFVTEMQKQALSRMVSTKHIRSALEETEGQESMFDRESSYGKKENV